jgi:hypothetical protein
MLREISFSDNDLLCRIVGFSKGAIQKTMPSSFEFTCSANYPELDVRDFLEKLDFAANRRLLYIKGFNLLCTWQLLCFPHSREREQFLSFPESLRPSSSLLTSA